LNVIPKHPATKSVLGKGKKSVVGGKRGVAPGCDLPRSQSTGGGNSI